MSVVAAAPASRWRVGLLVAIALAGLVVAMLAPPLRQDPAYHDFADRRTFLGIPYALNVVSNLGFLVVGAWALGAAARARLLRWERAAAYLFAVGLVPTGLGSAWYHLAPSNATLVWDRLPLSALFPIAFAVVIGDRVSAPAGRLLVLPLAVFGVVSVVWWDLTDDLRPYAVAQFLPLLLIPIMLALFPGRRPVGALVVGVALYAVGKVFELGDAATLALGGLVSGHTVKHVLAAVAAGFITRWICVSTSRRAPPVR